MDCLKLKDETTCVGTMITLSIDHIYKLHRLIINEQNKIINIHDLDDDKYFCNRRQDSEDINKPLIYLKGITGLTWKSSEQCEVEISFNEQLKSIQLCAKVPLLLLKGIPSIIFHGPMIMEDTDLFMLDKAKSISCYQCTLPDISMLTNIQQLTLSATNLSEPTSGFMYLQSVSLLKLDIKDISAFSSAQSVHIHACHQITDIRRLSNVKCLEIIECDGILYFPTPSGLNQTWLFNSVLLQDEHVKEFASLLTLTVDNCQQLTNLSMLGNIKQLTICNCPSIVTYPISSGRVGQAWTLIEQAISDLTGFNCLHQLNLLHCPEVYDLAPLSTIHTLQIINCNKVQDVRALAKVKLLHLEKCYELRDVSMLHEVEELRLTDCNNVESIEGLNNCFGKAAPIVHMSNRSKLFYNIDSFQVQFFKSLLK